MSEIVLEGGLISPAPSSGDAPMGSRARPGIRRGVPGVEAIFEYDGFVWNDRRFPDGAFIYDLGGFDDAEVRHQAEVNSGNDGEVPLNSLHGGRTLTLGGIIRAYNLGFLRNIKEEMDTALADLVEKPLYIRLGLPGYYERFAYGHIEDWTFIEGDGTIYDPNLTYDVRPLDLSRKVMYHSSRELRYEDIDLRALFYSGSSPAAMSQCVVAKYADETSYLFASMSGAEIAVKRRRLGIDSTLASAPFSPLANTWYWVRLLVIGDDAYAEVWNVEPSDETADTNAHLTMAGEDAAQFGVGISGYTGIRWDPASPDEKLDKIQAIPLRDNDVMIDVRKSAPLALKDQQNTDSVFRRDYMVTLRASEPWFVSTRLNDITLSAIQQVERGRVYDRVYDMTYDKYLTSDGAVVEPTASTMCVNLGNARSHPVFRIYGPVEDPVIRNDTFDQDLRLDAVIASGDYYEIDVEVRSIVDAYGTNRFGALAPGSDLLRFFPGVNELRMLAKSYGIGAKARVMWRHTWKG